MKIFRLICCLLVMGQNSLFGAMAAVETWDVSGDLAGWQRNTISSNVQVVDAGGNPGGYLYSLGNASGTFDIGAYTNRSTYTGDYSSAMINKISVDLQFISGTFDDAWVRFRYQSPAYNGWKYDLTDAFPINGWLSVGRLDRLQPCA